MLKEKIINLFKIEYHWYEGEYSEILLGKEVSNEKFEEDFIKAKEFAESLKGKKIKEGDYLGKGYRVECLPEFYGQIIWFLIKKLDYIDYNYDKDVKYDVDDSPTKKIQLSKIENKIERHSID